MEIRKKQFIEIKGPLSSRNYFLETGDNGRLRVPNLTAVSPQGETSPLIVRVEKIPAHPYSYDVIVPEKAPAVLGDGPELLLRTAFNQAVQAVSLEDEMADRLVSRYNHVAERISSNGHPLSGYSPSLVR